MSEMLADTPPPPPPPVAPKPKLKKFQSRDLPRPGTRQSGGTVSRGGTYPENTLKMSERDHQRQGDQKLPLEVSNKRRSDQDQPTVPKFRPFTEMVNLQRPSATRHSTRPKKSKTYADMLKDLKTETYGRPSDAKKLTKSDLQGSLYFLLHENPTFCNFDSLCIVLLPFSWQEKAAILNIHETKAGNGHF